MDQTRKDQEQPRPIASETTLTATRYCVSAGEKPTVRHALVRLAPFPPRALTCCVNSFACVGIEVQVSRHALVSPLARGADGWRRGRALCPEVDLFVASGTPISFSIAHLLVRLFAVHYARAATQRSRAGEERRSKSQNIHWWFVQSIGRFLAKPLKRFADRKFGTQRSCLPCLRRLVV